MEIFDSLIPRSAAVMDAVTDEKNSPTDLSFMYTVASAAVSIFAPIKTTKGFANSTPSNAITADSNAIATTACANI